MLDLGDVIFFFVSVVVFQFQNFYLILFTFLSPY